MSIAATAAFLAAFRRPDRQIPVGAAEALLLIADGCDSVAELQARMGLGAATACRLVSLLRGRARYDEGRWVESPFGLVLVRNHPHRRGHQLLLSPEGAELVRMHFGADVPPSIHSSAPTGGVQ